MNNAEFAAFEARFSFEQAKRFLILATVRDLSANALDNMGSVSNTETRKPSDDSLQGTAESS